MNIAVRVATAGLLACLAVPSAARAGGVVGQDAYEIADKLAAGKHYDTALKYYRRALKQDPGNAEAAEKARAIEERQAKKTARTDKLLETGKALFRKKKYREAEKALLQAASRDRSNPEIHFMLGEVYLQMEQYDRAKAEYKKAKSGY
jgi:tetratricopeptide (TPR) repeat protein